MPTVTITAAEGEKLQVRVQKREQKASTITTQGYDSEGNPTIVHAYGPKVTTWPDANIVSFVGEARDFEVNDEVRIVVEVA